MKITRADFDTVFNSPEAFSLETDAADISITHAKGSVEVSLCIRFRMGPGVALLETEHIQPSDSETHEVANVLSAVSDNEERADLLRQALGRAGVAAASYSARRNLESRN